jgi:hypothetical protein
MHSCSVFLSTVFCPSMDAGSSDLSDSVRMRSQQCSTTLWSAGVYCCYIVQRPAQVGLPFVTTRRVPPADEIL